MPARELSRPGLIDAKPSVKMGRDGEWQKQDTQEYSVQNPDIIIPPPPPKPHHPNRPNSTTYPRNHEPGALNHKKISLLNARKEKTHSGTCATAPNTFFPTSPVDTTFSFCKLVNVPGKSTNPANKIQVKNPASMLCNRGMLSSANSMLTYCVSIWVEVAWMRWGRSSVASGLGGEVFFSSVI